MPSTLLLAPQWIAPVAPDSAAVLTGHAVVIRGERIELLAPLHEARALHPQAEELSLPGHLLVPGFVNLHTHAAMSLLRGSGDDMPLQQWLQQRIWPLEAALLSPSFVYDGTLLAAREMLLGGTTCFNDMYLFPEAAARAALTLGMRSVHGITVIDFPSAYGAGPADYLRKGLELRDALRGEPLIDFTLAPHAPYTVADEPLRRIAMLSDELGLPIHIHLHETRDEIEQALARTGRRPLQRLLDLGLVGPQLIGVHAVHLNEAELQLLAQRGVRIAHCPHSNLKLASGIAPLAHMDELNLCVGIGTDGSASNNRLDLLAEARTAALLAKGSCGRAETWPAHRSLRAMTLDGARALGLEQRIGSIEAGKAADLVAVDLSAAELAPVYEPLSQLIYACGREHVAHVWIAGRHVVRKRQLTDTVASSALDEVVGRTAIWHNRAGEILSSHV